MRGDVREKIVAAGRELFNRSGTVAVTTNHIARHLKISPGHFYFYFSNREALVRVLFAELTREVYAAWDPRARLTLDEFLARSAGVFWNYRFFHREMYHLRRQDPELSRAWRRHLKRCEVLWRRNYEHWAASGTVRPVADAAELRALSESVLLHSSAALSFFESAEREASPRAVGLARERAERAMAHYVL